MSITIKLDAPALMALIDNDPEFKLELQRSVISLITKQLYTKDVSLDVQKLVDTSFAAHKLDLINAVQNDIDFRKAIEARLSTLVQSVKDSTYSYSTTRKLSPELSQLIDKQVKTLVDAAVKEQVGTIKDRVDRAQKEMTEAVIARIGKLGGVIEHDWKVEMHRQIREDVTKALQDKLAAL